MHLQYKQVVDYLLARGGHGLTHGTIFDSQENPTVRTSEMLIPTAELTFMICMRCFHGTNLTNFHHDPQYGFTGRHIRTPRSGRWSLNQTLR